MARVSIDSTQWTFNYTGAGSYVLLLWKMWRGDLTVPVPGLGRGILGRVGALKIASPTLLRRASSRGHEMMAETYEDTTT